MNTPKEIAPLHQRALLFVVPLVMTVAIVFFGGVEQLKPPAKAPGAMETQSITQSAKTNEQPRSTAPESSAIDPLVDHVYHQGLSTMVNALYAHELARLGADRVQISLRPNTVNDEKTRTLQLQTILFQQQRFLSTTAEPMSDAHRRLSQYLPTLTQTQNIAQLQLIDGTWQVTVNPDIYPQLALAKVIHLVAIALSDIDLSHPDPRANMTTWETPS
jgi:hypothetical protein